MYIEKTPARTQSNVEAGVVMNDALANSSVIAVLMVLLALPAKSEEPTKTHDAFYKFGRGIGWTRDRVGDVGSGFKAWINEETGKVCPRDFAEMSDQCLDQRIRALSEELLEAKLQKAGREAK